ncbi:TPA: hypothetical protein DCE37_02260 [Candidatus Latescibacteria bacterium]|nr:hypothetical protein [Candidatus Latescibacterota bacterium]
MLPLLSDPEEVKMWRSSTGAQLEIAWEKSREGFIRAMAFPNWKTRAFPGLYRRSLTLTSAGKHAPDRGLNIRMW